MRLTTHLAGALLLALVCAPVVAGDVLPIPPSGVIGTDDAMFSPEYWVARASETDKLILDKSAIDALNARLLANDPSMTFSRNGSTVRPASLLRGWHAPCHLYLERLNHPPRRDVMKVETVMLQGFFAAGLLVCALVLGNMLTTHAAAPQAIAATAVVTAGR